MLQKYDVQQVCENGHQITGGYQTYPGKRKKFCQACSAPTLIACPACDANIQGAPIKAVHSFLDARSGRQRMTLEGIVPVPSYCANCGEPYPWTEIRIRATVQNLVEFGDLNEEEKKTIEQDIENIAKDVPDAELSARRVKRIWDRGTPIAYEFIMELASRTIAQILKNP